MNKLLSELFHRPATAARKTVQWRALLCLLLSASLFPVAAQAQQAPQQDELEAEDVEERIDELESTVGNLQRCLQEVAAGRQLNDVCRGEAQSLKDREILEFLGENTG